MAKIPNVPKSLKKSPLKPKSPVKADPRITKKIRETTTA